MNKYFIQLFLKENTVVLPGFGALTAPDGNVEEIMFMPFLKTDDSKLVDFIVETEGIDPQDAQNTIAKFIREMEANLSKGESFDIFQFGSFFKNETGDIEFKSWLIKNANKQEEKTDEPAPSLSEGESEEKTEESVSILSDGDSEEVSLPEPEGESPVEAQIEDIEEKIKEHIVDGVSAFEMSEPEPIQTAIPLADEPEIIVAQVKQEGDKKKRKVLPIWIISICLLSALAFAAYYFFIRTQKKSEPVVAKNEINKEKDTVTQEDTLIVQPVQKQKNKKEIKPIAPAPKNSSTEDGAEILPENAQGFFLIGGVYTSKKVAINKVQEAKKDGLNAKILPQGATQFFISLSDFTDKIEANKMLVSLREKGYKVWILKK